MTGFFAGKKHHGSGDILRSSHAKRNVLRKIRDARFAMRVVKHVRFDNTGRDGVLR